MNKFDLNKARTFIEVVDSGSITAAANRLRRTQQAISLQLQNLEEELELELFHRKGPKITLTKVGQQLYQSFRPKFSAIESAVMQLKLGQTQTSGVIRIGAWMEQGVSYLPEIISQFRKKFPLVDFELEIAMDQEIERKLRDNHLDIGFLVYTQDKNIFKREAVYRQPLLPVVSRRYLLQHKRPKSIKDTLSMPVLDYAGEYSAYFNWIKQNAKELLPLARKKIPVVTSSNNVVLKQMVMQGLGLGFLHQEAIQTDLDTGELIPLFARKSKHHITVEVDMVYKRKHSLGFVQQQFIGFVHHHRKSWMVL